MPEGTTIHLDHAASTPPLPAVLDEMRAVATTHFANPSSNHALGAAARKRLEDAREFLRGTLGAADLVFTSGGTEADVLGLVGGAFARSPGRVLVGAADHPATRNPGDALKRAGYRLETVPVSEDGDIEPEPLFERLGRDVRAVSLLHGHNELGTLSRLDELVATIRKVAPEAHVHVDLVQAYGKLDFDLAEVPVDSVAVSGHKLRGPRGVGFLALNSSARVVALQPGGGHEGGRRGGTENLPGIAGLVVAAEHALSHLAAHTAHVRALCKRALEALRAAFPDTELLGHPRRRLPHVLALRIPGVVGETLQERMAAHGIAFSTGAACKDGKGGGRSKPGGGRAAPANPVHEAIGLAPRESREVIRLSFGPDTTVGEVDTAMAALIAEARALLELAPSS